MELPTLLNLLKTDPKKLIEKIQSDRPNEEIKSIQPEDHEVMDPLLRKDREVEIGNGIFDPVTRQEGTRKTYEPVTRIPSPIEKNIIDWAAQMAAGTPVECYALPENDSEQTLYDMVKHSLKSNKCEFLDKTVVRLMGTYKRCAEVWFSENCEPTHWGQIGTFKKRMRMMLLSKETGDILYLVTNNTGDAIALTREYKVKDEDGKDVNKFDIWINGAYITFTQASEGWTSVWIDQTYGKASFVYYSQDRLEYEDIIQKRKRLETLDSDHADQNLATGSPIIVAKGIVTLGKRGETGKVFQVDGKDGDMKILEAAGSPESLKMERENLLNGIYYDTNTPNMSIFDAEGMGANTPGITIKLRFLPATLKAMNKQSGAWGMGVQRRYNFLKAACAVINVGVASAVGMDISPRFQVYLPSNETENYNNIIALVTAGLMSTRTAVTKLGFTDNIDEEIAAIEAEVAKRAALAPKVVPPLNT